MDKNAPLHLRPNRNDKTTLPSSSSKTHLFSSLSPRSSYSFLLLQIVLFLHFILVRPLPFVIQHRFRFKNPKPPCFLNIDFSFKMSTDTSTNDSYEADDYLHSNDFGESRQEVLEMW